MSNVEIYVLGVLFSLFVVVPYIALKCWAIDKSKIAGNYKVSFSPQEYEENIKRVKKIQSDFSVTPIFPDKTPHEVVLTGGRLLQKEGFRITENLGRI